MKRSESADKVGNTRYIYWAAWLSIGALVAHTIDAPDHLREWWGYSTFFITAGAFQFFYGLGLFLQPWRYDETGAVRVQAEQQGHPYYVAGLAMTVCTIVAFVISRTTGIPWLGPDAAPAPVTLLGLVPSVEALPLTYCLARLVSASRRG
jgi:hypothetical protein